MNNIDAGLGLLHIATGAFYTLSGSRKCFLPTVRAKVCNLITSKGVPLTAAHAVIGGELVGGLGLLTGTLTHLAAFGLLIIMAGAYITDTWPEVKRKEGFLSVNGVQVHEPNWRSKLVSNALCTPEAQLLIILATLVMTGAGALSIDGLLF